MSLAVLANHMATKGRHGDDMLVHMSRDEVEHLQKLAKAHGLTLTINPDTGLPEAFSLKSLIKAVAPMALGAFLGPAGFGLTGFQSALAVGGIGALATGSLEKGLMMGLGAYGGAELGAGVKAAGEGVLADKATSTAIASPAESAAQAAQTAQYTVPYNYQAPSLASGVPPQEALRMSELAAQKLPVETITQTAPLTSTANVMGSPIASDLANYNAAQVEAATPQSWKNLSFEDKLSAGYEGVSKDPMAFAKKYAMPGLAALYSGAALGQETPDLKGPNRRQGYIRNYGFDPYSGTFTPGSIVPTTRYAAEGGIVALAQGGTGPQDLDNPTDNNLKAVQDLYAGLGRTGDQEGINYWTGRLNAGESLADVANAFGASANYVQQQQAQQQPTTVTSAPAAATGATAMPGTITNTAAAPAAPAAPAATGIANLQQTTSQPTAEQLRTVTNIYQNVLGRDPDAEGLNYWAGRLAQGESLADVYGALQGSAKYVLGAGATTAAPGLAKTLTQATSPYAGYKSADATSIGDEWVRNVLGREATDADRRMGWYQSLADLTTTGDTDTAYKNFLNAYGLSGQRGLPSWFEASQLKPVAPRTTPSTTGNMPGWTFDPNATVGSGLVRPNEPAGETTAPGTARATPTMQDVVNAYTRGGGQTGRLPYVPRSLAEQERLYNRLTGSSRSAYDYLMGRGAYPIRPVSEGPVALPYGQAVMGLPASIYNTHYIYDPAKKQYIINPDYVDPELPTPKKEGEEKEGEEKETKTKGKRGGLLRYADGGIAELAGYSAQEMASVGRPTEGYASAYNVRPKKRGSTYTGSLLESDGGHSAADINSVGQTAWGNSVAAAMADLAALGIGALGNAAQGPNSAPAGYSTIDPGTGLTTTGPSPGNNAFSPDPAPGFDPSLDLSGPAGEGGVDMSGDTSSDGNGGYGMARGGYAGGGIYNLGSYSDGGRLLKGPGDGVSDSIPATIGNKQPARLADGEFVIPARIVSELGNGSTDAGARKLYAMMDRIQARRGKTTGKGKVAVNSRADKLLPA